MFKTYIDGIATVALYHVLCALDWDLISLYRNQRVK